MAAHEPESGLTARDAQLASLVKNAAWPEFLKALDEQIDTATVMFARDAMRQAEGGIPEGDLQFRRGVIHGIRQAVKVAHGARARFDRHSEEEK